MFNILIFKLFNKTKFNNFVSLKKEKLVKSNQL